LARADSCSPCLRSAALDAGFERDELARYTPCTFGNLEDVVEALAVGHCELVLIHLFRKGNGRVSRLLSTLMALQGAIQTDVE